MPLALGFFYAYWRLHESSENLLEPERRFCYVELWSDCGPITVLWCLFNDFVSFPAASSR
jgi:hypothetical protein